MEASSSLKISSEILPYQFEPSKSKLADEWSDSSYETVEEDSDDVEKELIEQDRCRSNVEAEVWCRCGNCQRKFRPIECICCTELEETKNLLANENIGESYTYT